MKTDCRFRIGDNIIFNENRGSVPKGTRGVVYDTEWDGEEWIVHAKYDNGSKHGFFQFRLTFEDDNLSRIM